MKKSIPVRILTALGGIALLALAGWGAATTLFGLELPQSVQVLLESREPVAVLVKISALLALAALGASTVLCALPGRKQTPSGYVMQKGGGDSFGISIHSIEKDVRACVSKHPEIMEAEVDVREGRSGLIILVDVDQVGGVDIPLFVSQLQKQVRQYVQKRTGKEVAEVRVMVDCRTETEIESRFAVEDSMMAPAVVNAAAAVEEFHQEGQIAETPVEQVRQLAEIAMQVQPEIEKEPEEEPALPAEPDHDIVETLEQLDAQLTAAAVPDLFEEDEKSMHQRVFGAEEMPQMVPVPPEMTVEPHAEEAPAAPAEEPEEEPAEPVEPAAPILPEEEDVQWTEPSLQVAADAMLTGDLEAPATEDAQEAAEAECVKDDCPEEAQEDTAKSLM